MDAAFVSVRPLRFPKWGEAAKHGRGYYYTNDGVFAINRISPYADYDAHGVKSAQQQCAHVQWYISLVRSMQDCYPQLTQSFHTSGMREARFHTRQAAVTALEAFIRSDCSE